MSEEVGTTLVAPWVVRVTLGMMGILLVLFIVVTMHDFLDLQRFRLVSADPLIIEDTFDNTLWTTVIDGATLWTMKVCPLSESTNVLTADPDGIKMIKLFREQEE